MILSQHQELGDVALLHIVGEGHQQRTLIFVRCFLVKLDAQIGIAILERIGRRVLRIVGVLGIGTAVTATAARSFVTRIADCENLADDRLGLAAILRNLVLVHKLCIELELAAIILGEPLLLGIALGAIDIAFGDQALNHP